MPSESTKPGGHFEVLALVLLWLVWLLATPHLWWGAVITATPFYGDQPTAEESATASRLMRAALICGFGIPLVGLAACLALRRHVMAVLFVVTLGVTVVAALATGTISPETLKPVETTSPVPSHQHIGCQERSGGDSDCPGG
ncbi:hypothetical protein [Thermoactinospora rubra]|uniref:hypothetical protein n=1 Tax=Thermoactinospora rubra TaxID=1088767 RepID=UPI000A11DD4F|nr:hypothetical protein [Thermoactinospora rubra]